MVEEDVGTKKYDDTRESSETKENFEDKELAKGLKNQDNSQSIKDLEDDSN